METPFEFGSYKTVGGYDASVYERIKYDGKLFLYGSVKLRNDTYREAPMFWSENGEVYVPSGKWTLDDKVWIFHPHCKGPGLAILYSTKTYNSIFQSPCFNLTAPKPEPMNESKLTPPIKPGKYKMRNGHQAIIVGSASETTDIDFPIVGFLSVSSSKGTAEQWTSSGRYFSGCQDSEHDLISTWIDAPIFKHWDKVPWAKCVYRHRGEWWALSELVEWCDKDSSWDYTTTIVDKYVIKCSLYGKDYPTFTGHDKDSLILRPANV